MDIELGRDPPYRPMLRGRVSDRLQRHPGGPLPQLLAVLPRCCHSPSSFLESEPAPNPGRNIGSFTGSWSSVWWMSRQHPSQQGHEPSHIYDALDTFTTNHGEPV